MPIVMLAFGIVLAWVGIRGTHGALGKLIGEDLKGYVFWVIAIVMIGSLGYIKTLRPLSVGFLTLLMIGLLLNNPGIWQEIDRLTKAFRSIAPISAGFKPINSRVTP